MVYVRAIDADLGCADCSAIRFLCLSDGQRVSREDLHGRVREGLPVRSRNDAGPRLVAVERGGTRYVRTRPDDTPFDNLLSLPRVCR